VHFEGYDQEHQTKDILIKNIYWNGELVKEIDKENFVIGKYTENITYEADDLYAKIKENTVD
jgi:hypothetical protein